MSHSLLGRLRKRFSGGTKTSHSATRKPRSVRLGVESLEKRELLTSTLNITQWDVNQPYTGTIMNFGSAVNPWDPQATGLPPGLRANRYGATITLSGTPTQTGSFSVHLEEFDYGTTYVGTYNLTINPAPSLGILSTTPWTLGRAGSATIAVSGGTQAYSNLAVTGLPAGLTATLSASTITLSGTPTQFGTFSNVAVSLQDSGGGTVHRPYSMTVAPLLSPGTLPAATAGQSYGATFGVTGSSGHYSFALASGTLPGGMSLSSAGVLSGTTTRAGGYSFAVRATDTATGGVIATQSYYLLVNPTAASRLVFSTPTDPIYAGMSFDVSVQAFDRYDNAVSGVPVTLSPPPSGTTHLTADSGRASFSVVETVATSYTLTASAPGIAAITSNAVRVLGGRPTNLDVNVSTNDTNAGIPFHVSIRGTDAYGNVSDYVGDVWLLSSDGQPVTPATIHMEHVPGRQYNAEGDVKLYKAGTVTLTAVFGLASGVTRGPVTVHPLSATHFVLTSSPSVNGAYFAGTPFSLTVTALDIYGNTDTRFGGNDSPVSAALSSSDGHPVSPSEVQLSNGTVTKPVLFALETWGDITLTARSGMIRGTSPNIHVLQQAGNGTASARVHDSRGDTLVLYPDGTVWEQPRGDSLWHQVNDRVSRLVSDANGNVFTLDCYSDLKKLDSLYLWTMVRSNVPSLVSDAWGEVFVLNSSDQKVYQYSGNGSAQWSAWVVNTPAYLPAETMVRDATGNVFVQAGHDALYVHRRDASNGGHGWWDWLSNGLTNLVINASGNLFALNGFHSVCQIGPDSSGLWSTGIRLTVVLGNVNSLAAMPNGTLLAVGIDGIVRSSTTGQSGTWQSSYSEMEGVATIAVTPCGVAYELAYSGRLKYSTTGLPGSWQTAYYYAPGNRPGDGVQAGDDVHGLANGRDGRVYFLAGGNVYQVLSDGIGTVVRDQISARPANAISFDQALNRVGVQNVMGKTSSFLQQLDGTDQTTETVARSVGQLLNTSVGIDFQTLLYDGYQVAKDGFDVIKDIVSDDPEAILDYAQLVIDTSTLINAC
jgi:hypothetical protein